MRDENLNNNENFFSIFEIFIELHEVNTLSFIFMGLMINLISSSFERVHTQNIVTFYGIDTGYGLVIGFIEHITRNYQ
jgi:hypothetical protein